MNIHRQTFEEILNLNSKSHKDCERIFWTSFQVTFKNFGKIFKHSFMCERDLVGDAKKHQSYAESIARKYNCKVSYHAVYSADGCIDNIWKVREELIGKMYVSPVFWVPMKSGNSCCFKTFAFGFFPYSEKKPFIYDDSIEVDTTLYRDNITFDNIEEYTINEDTLQKMISKRIKLIDVGASPNKITFDKINWFDKKEKPFYGLYPQSVERIVIDTSMYFEDLTSQEYFLSVVKDCDVDCFVLPEYKMLFVKTNEVCDICGQQYEADYQKLIKAYDLLSERIAVSDITELVFDGKWCYAFGYDDTRYDSVLQHLGFFDTWEYFD